MDPVYKDGTTAYDILQDGWSRGFESEQTHQELSFLMNGWRVV
jgi:hypothetical protein